MSDEFEIVLVFIFSFVFFGCACIPVVVSKIGEIQKNWGGLHCLVDSTIFWSFA